MNHLDFRSKKKERLIIKSDYMDNLIADCFFDERILSKIDSVLFFFNSKSYSLFDSS